MPEDAVAVWGCVTLPRAGCVARAAAVTTAQNRSRGEPFVEIGTLSQDGEESGPDAPAE